MSTIAPVFNRGVFVPYMDHVRGGPAPRGSVNEGDCRYLAMEVRCRRADLTHLPAEITPTKIRWLKITVKFPTDMRIPLLDIKILLQSNPLKSGIVVRRLVVWPWPNQRRGMRPISELRLLISESLMQADSWLREVEFLGPEGIPQEFRLRDP